MTPPTTLPPAPPATPLEAIFRPRGIAVIGASRHPGTVGRQIFVNLLAGGFQGPVYPVNPHARDVASVKAYGSVLDVPDPVDLAVIVVPASKVLAVAEECGRRGVKGLIVITAGFREVGGEGAERERRLNGILQEYGMRAIGPNCMGVVNADPSISMNATFSPSTVKSGGIAFVSQSGALGMAILDQAADLGLGLSYFVSLGNKTNLSTNDLLLEWETDPRVTTILLYLENFGNPRKFVELARRIAPRKPIIAVKSGRTAAGARAASSHTGALAEKDTLTEALFEACGVIRAQTIKELFDYARLFSRSPLPPEGKRVGIVTNSGGPGIMATDALLEQGLAVAGLSEETTRRLRERLLPEASVHNPVDVIAGGGPEDFRTAVTALLADPNVDMVLAIYTPPVFIDEAAVVRAIAEPDRQGKPLVACVLGRESGGTAFRRLTEAGIPTFTFPEAAVRAMAAHAAYGARRKRPAEPLTVPEGTDRARARGIVERALAAGTSWLPPEEATALLSAYGIPTAPGLRVATPEGAAAAARTLGVPMALKAIAPGLLHKTEAGGVALSLATPEEAAAAYATMERRVAEHGYPLEGALAQPMIPPGREVVLGMTADPKFGPLLMFGLGGIYVEVLKDVVFRLAPLTRDDARRMVRAIRGHPLLEGIRGEAPADVPAIEEALLRLSALVMDLPEVAEIDVNPLVVQPEGMGVCAPDARVRLWPRGEAPKAPAVVADLPRRGQGGVGPE